MTLLRLFLWVTPQQRREVGTQGALHRCRSCLDLPFRRA